METREFALDPTGTRRIQLFQTGSGGDVVVLLNNSVIGSISEREALTAGKKFTLEDGTVLTVQSINNELQVLHADQPLVPLPQKDATVAEVHSQPAMAATPMSVTAVQSAESSSPTFSAQKNAGWIIALVGALVALLAFFSMPYISAGFFSFTAQQIASVGNQVGGQFGNFQALWLEPVIAGGLLLFIGYELIASMNSATSTQGGATTLVVLTSLILVFLIGKLLFSDSQPLVSTNFLGQTTTSPSLASYYGSGFWMYIVGIIIMLAGGIVALRSAKSSTME